MRGGSGGDACPAVQVKAIHDMDDDCLDKDQALGPGLDGQLTAAPKPMLRWSFSWRQHLLQKCLGGTSTYASL